ncbi:MAG: protein-glutamate O-methyltransferase CheR [Thermoanaerobaculia bacterium]|nr:protein-glutamate O-methyltransferase CheR [Thermoanaerobaculia bacterium]
MQAYLPRLELEEYRLLNELITDLIGVHFPPPKLAILESRLRPRLQQLQLDRFMDYYLVLQYDLDSELPHLTHLVTNNETYFFRETYQFEALFEDALDGLMGSATPAGRPLAVLCAGCSSGEEPYTLSVHAADIPKRRLAAGLVIDAIDVDQARLEAAERAEYGPNSLRVATEEQIRDCFRRSGTDRYTLLERFREGVAFAHGNILDRATYPRPAGYDVIFCRNVLIYFSETALHRAVQQFADALRPGGILFLGHAESIIGLSPRFETVRLKRCIAYRRT